MSAAAASVVRRALPLTVVAALVTVLPASASHTSTPCLTFKDDGRGVVEENAGRPSHDVVGGRIASDSRSVTATVALSRLPEPSDPADAFLDYTFSFTVNGQRLFLSAPADPGIPGSYGVLLVSRRVTLGQPTISRDAKAGHLRMTVPLNGFAPFVSLRTRMVADQMTAQTIVSPTTAATAAAATTPLIVLDLAEGRDATYRFGDPSCPVVRKRT